MSHESLQEAEAIAHTGVLARITGHFARHPWRAVFTWVGIIAVLIGMQGPFAGSLKNEFKLPGSDFQKATHRIHRSAQYPSHITIPVVVRAPR